jgi:hypothetical protein
MPGIAIICEPPYPSVNIGVILRKVWDGNRTWAGARRIIPKIGGGFPH